MNTAVITAATPSSELLLGTVALGSSGTATLSEPASLLSAGDGTIRALYSGDGVFEGSAGSTTVTADVDDFDGSAPDRAEPRSKGQLRAVAVHRGFGGESRRCGHPHRIHHRRSIAEPDVLDQHQHSRERDDIR